MRQPNHNKNRARGRGRRQGGNPANRVYDSNGPDVRVRGTAQTVADKYQQLARDAQAASDAVKAESYYQHAEHYLRLIAATQVQRQQRNAEQNARNNDQASQQNGHDKAADKAPVAAAPNAEETPAAEAPASKSDDNWQGHQPEFLKAPVGEAEAKAPSQPKPRTRARKKKPSDEPTPDMSEGSETDTVNAG